MFQVKVCYFNDCLFIVVVLPVYVGYDGRSEYSGITVSLQVSGQKIQPDRAFRTNVPELKVGTSKFPMSLNAAYVFAGVSEENAKSYRIPMGHICL